MLRHGGRRCRAAPPWSITVSIPRNGHSGVSGNGRALWCGRLTPTKGHRGRAIEAARAAGVALDIIGPIDCQTYFDEEVAAVAR